MREIIIAREVLSEVSACSVLLDGVVAASVGNGETIRLEVNNRAHEIATSCAGGQGNVLKIPAGEGSITFDVVFSLMSCKFDLVSMDLDEIAAFEASKNIQARDDAYNSQTVFSEAKPNKSFRKKFSGAPKEPPKSPTACYVSSIITTVILLIACVVIYATLEVSVVALIIACVLTGAYCAVMIIGGFWIIIIPLPYFFIWKAGCVKPNQPTGRKILLGCAAVMLPVLAIILLFVIPV